jgi:P4 family phage/plasmid primase-like protien
MAALGFGTSRSRDDSEPSKERKKTGGFYPKKGPRSFGSAERKQQKRYVYCNATGQPVHFVDRMQWSVDKRSNDPKPRKTFTQGHYGPKGEEIYKTPEILYLYNLPAIREAIQRNEPIFIVEGEKCATELIERGLPATCSAGGAKGWKRYYVGQLNLGRKDPTIFILPDNDQPGKDYAETVAKDLRDAGYRNVYIIPPSLMWETIDASPGKGDDVYDFIAKGGTCEDIMKVANSVKSSNNNQPVVVLDEHRKEGSLSPFNREALAEALPLEGPFTHTFFAKLINKTFPDKVIVVDGNLYLWTGKRWESKLKDECLFLATDLAELYHLKLKNIASNKEEKTISGIISQLENASFANKVITMLLNTAAVRERKVSLDGKQMAGRIAVEDGVITCATGVISDHKPTNYNTSYIPGLRFDPNTTCPQWESFIKSLFPDTTIREFVQRFIGQALASFSGNNAERVMLWLIGPTGSGKSTFLNVLGDIFGGYFFNGVRSDIFSSTLSGNERSQLYSALDGKRLASIQEYQGGKIDSVTLKSVVSADIQLARALYQRPGQAYMPTFIVATNTLPQWQHADAAAWDRVLVIRDVGSTLPRDQRNPELPAILEAEAAGILNWVIAGAQDYLERGLSIPIEIKSNTENIESTASIWAMFAVTCLRKTTGNNLRASKIQQAYLAYAKYAGLKTAEDNSTVMALQGRLDLSGFKTSLIDGEVWALDIELNPDYEYLCR